MTAPDITLCMIVKNEAKHLEKCLSSVQGLVSEIIIADTGSEDNSKDIALKFGAKVIDIPWENDFAKARNLSLEYATSPWILVLDADEAIDHWREEQIQHLLDAAHIHGYWLPIIHYISEASETDFVTDHVCRLFRNDNRIIFRGIIHEETASSIWELLAGEIAFAEWPIYHYGYLEEELQRKNKYQRNLALINSGLQLQPSHLILRYALGVEYYQQEQYKAAADILHPLLAEVPAQSGYAFDIYLKTAYALQLCGHNQEAEEVFHAGSLLFPDFIDLLEGYATLLLEQGQLGKARHFLKQALKNRDTAHKYPSSSGSGTYRTELLAGKVCEKLFLYSNAREHYEVAIQFKPDYMDAWKQLAPLSLLSGERLSLISLTRCHLHSFSPVTLAYLVPAAFNARDLEWLTTLSTAPQLPPAVQTIVQAFLTCTQQQEGHHSLEPLEQLLHDPSVHSKRSSILGYLWALSCRAGDTESAMKWLVCITPYRPGMLSIHHILTGRSGIRPALPDLSYATQLLLQVGAWDSGLTLYRQSAGSSFQWCKLPPPLFYGLLEAPISVKKQWCSIYANQNLHYNSSMDCAEWLLYAAIAFSCGETPKLALSDEMTLRKIGGTTAAIGLSYYKLLLAAKAYPHGVTSGHIPWGLLVKSAIQT
ncbi:glycosyltransferase [Paenibacillus sp. FSL R10-2734]|uniref:tetratricopeptide repeat-containing glycosyltransferase family 2 protein n=1 Tax=Paenibacillus sp. FSL R10-2734 TaxID=2954691 RepID=UPI0030D8AD52